MAVAVDSFVSDLTSNAVLTKSLTTLTVGTGLKRALIVALTLQPVATAISLHWDTAGTNQALTLIGSVTDTGSKAKLYLYGLVAPTSGAKTLTASWTTSSDVVIAAGCFTGVNPAGGTATFAHFSSSTGTGTAPTGSVTSATGNYTVGCWGTFAGFSSVIATQWYFDNTATNFSSGGSRITGAGTVNYTAVTTPSQPWGFAGVDIVAAPLISPSIGFFRMPGIF